MIHFSRASDKTFSVYSNRFVSDKTLSFEAKATLRYLLSKPDNWCVCKNAMKSALGVGRCVLDRVAGELISAGYMAKASGGRYLVAEEPRLLKNISRVKTNILRCSNDERKKGYSVTIDAPFNNKEIPLSARGMLCYLLSKPEDWEPKARQLTQASRRCTVRSAERLLRELRRHGHVARVQEKDDNGRVKKWVTDVYEDREDNPEYCADYAYSGSLETHNVEKQHLVNTDIITNKVLNNSPNPSKVYCGNIAEPRVEDILLKDFRLLVSAYPSQRRGNFDDAFAEYREAVSSEESMPTAQQIVNTIRVLENTEQWTEEDGRFIPKLKNWIHNRGWTEVDYRQFVDTVDEAPSDPETAYAYGLDRLTRSEYLWQEENPGKEISDEDFVWLVRKTEGIAPWVRILLSGCHEDVVRASGKFLRNCLDTTPGLEAFLQENHPHIFIYAEEYLKSQEEEHGTPGQR